MRAGVRKCSSAIASFMSYGFHDYENTLRCIVCAEFLLWILSVISSSDVRCDCSLRGVVVKIDTSVAAEKVINN